jgi:hypothetical protein
MKFKVGDRIYHKTEYIVTNDPFEHVKDAWFYLYQAGSRYRTNDPDDDFGTADLSDTGTDFDFRFDFDALKGLPDWDWCSPNSDKTVVTKYEPPTCDCGAFKTYGKNCGKAAHYHWCSLRK